jgi:DNA-binding MarR family transcriptional regulator
MENNKMDTDHYFEIASSFESLHRLFLDVVKNELYRLKIYDINVVQFLILYKMGTRKVTIGEVTEFGYYSGSNVSYNLSKLANHNYIIRETCVRDPRAVYVYLSPKGLELINKFNEIFEIHVTRLKEIGDVPEDDADLVKYLYGIKKFWTYLLVR